MNRINGVIIEQRDGRFNDISLHEV